MSAVVTPVPELTHALGKAGNCIRTGIPWVQPFRWEAALNLTSYTARLVVWSDETADATARATLTSAGDEITLLDVTSSDDEDDPNIICELSDTATTALASSTTDDSWFRLTLTDGAGRDYPVAEGPCPIKFWSGS